jgi:hypothetical protein
VSTRHDANFGYTFGYRHQFGLFTLNCAKLLSSMHLALAEITPNFAYLSMIYGVRGKLKIPGPWNAVFAVDPQHNELGGE